MDDPSKFFRGARYYQLFHHFPAVEVLFFPDYVKNYDADIYLSPMKSNNYVIPILAVFLYLLMCFYGQKVMTNMKPFKVRSLLLLWNLSLSLFSAWGALHTVPHLLYRLYSETFESTICEAAYTGYGAGACGFAVFLFILSKIPELIDTAFIIVMKKDLIFLHWYHHVTVLLFSWNSYVTEAGSGLYFVAMNYTVHSIMYFYFFLSGAKMVPKWFNPSVITAIQISQMVLGIGVVVACLYYHIYGGAQYAPGECNNEYSNLLAGSLIYGSYLYLFVEFFVNKVARTKEKKT